LLMVSSLTFLTVASGSTEVSTWLKKMNFC
jgi:hypothetical protein